MKLLKHQFVVSGLVLLLSSCAASLPKQQVFDHAGHAQVKTIHVMPMPKVETQVIMLNNPAGSFGLIGAMIASGQAASKQHRLTQIYSGEPLYPMEYFQSELTKDLTDRGYKVVWPELRERAQDKRDHAGLRATYSPVRDADAILDVRLNLFGFVAAGAGHDSPYRPTATGVARLMGADGKQTYFTDYFAYNNILNSKIAVTMEPDPHYSYPRFGDLERAGKESQFGLKLALAELAKKISSEL